MRTKTECDNTDCKTPKETVYLTILTKDFHYNNCYWCANCIERDSEMVEIDEWSLMKAQKKLMKL